MAELKRAANQKFKTKFCSWVVTYKNGSQVLVEHRVKLRINELNTSFYGGGMDPTYSRIISKRLMSRLFVAR
jgi:hypothetical protein